MHIGKYKVGEVIAPCPSSSLGYRPESFKFKEPDNYLEGGREARGRQIKLVFTRPDLADPYLSLGYARWLEEIPTAWRAKGSSQMIAPGLGVISPRGKQISEALLFLELSTVQGQDNH